MPLLLCHDCNSQFSDRAATCPHCGAPGVAQLSPERPLAGMIIIGLFVAWVLLGNVRLVLHLFSGTPLPGEDLVLQLSPAMPAVIIALSAVWTMEAIALAGGIPFCIVRPRQGRRFVRGTVIVMAASCFVIAGALLNLALTSPSVSTLPHPMLVGMISGTIGSLFGGLLPLSAIYLLFRRDRV